MNTCYHWANVEAFEKFYQNWTSSSPDQLCFSRSFAHKVRQVGREPD